MKSTIASCGHYTPAVGYEGSIARKRCEAEPCFACRELEREREAEEQNRVPANIMAADEMLRPKKVK